MGKLSRAQMSSHKKAVELLSKPCLTMDEKLFILEAYNEGATILNGMTSAHFTPLTLAESFAVEVPQGPILDLGCGIGTLSFACATGARENGANMTLVEIQEEYVKVARKLLPEAEIIVGDIFDPALQAELRSRSFAACISNPPYGNFSQVHNCGPRYKGRRGEYAVIDVASDLADYGVFLIPQNSTPFRYSGTNGYRRLNDENCLEYARFRDTTGIEFGFNCGIDTQACDSFRGVSIVTEIIVCDFYETRQKRAPAQEQRVLEFALTA